MSKNTISKNEYLQLIGLKVLAEKAHDQIQDAIESMADILDEQKPNNNNYYGHISDMAWDKDYSVDKMLENMEVVIRPEKPTANDIKRGS